MFSGTVNSLYLRLYEKKVIELLRRDARHTPLYYTLRLAIRCEIIATAFDSKIPLNPIVRNVVFLGHVMRFYCLYY